MNKTILTLNKQNNYKKNIINNYENNNNNKNNFVNLEESDYNKYINTNITKYKQKYYCKICSNKKFKSQQYLDGHIKRRHPEYFHNFIKKQNKKEKSILSNYDKKLNDMKAHFEILINQLIKKNHYIRLNEKLNGLEKILLMNKNQEENNIVYDNIQHNNTDNIQETNSYNEENILINYNNDNNINSNNRINKINEENKKEIGILNNDDNEEKNNKKKEKEIMKRIKNFKKKLNQFYSKYMKEIIELNNEKKFQLIKKYFENNSEDDDNPSHRLRRHNKVQTIKEQNKNKLFEIQFGYDQFTNKNRDEDIKTSKNAFFCSNKNTIEKIDLKNKNKNQILNELDKMNNDNEKEIINSNSHRDNKSEKTSEEKVIFPNEKEIQFESDNNSQLSEKSQLFNKFYSKFRKRDGHFSKGNEKDYLKKIIPDDYNINNDEIEKIIDNKINQKLNIINNNKKDDLISDIIKLYYQILDQNSIYGYVHWFYSRNIIGLMNINKLIDNVNNLYYEGADLKGIKSYLERSNKLNQNQGLFETVNYYIDQSMNEGSEDIEESEKNNFSFRK